MMRTLRFLVVCSLLAAGTAWAQDWKGKSTLTGTVTDPTGKPLGGATVTATFVDAKAGPPETKTNGRGEFEFKNLAEGKWVIRISKEKFDPKEAPVEIGGTAKSPHLSVRLAPFGSGGANEALAAGDQKGQQLIAEKKFAEARALYQDLLAKYPQALTIRVRIAQAYDGEGQYAQAAAELKTFLDASKWSDLEMVGYYAGESAKAGNADEALRVLTAIPTEAMKSPTDFQECGFTLLRAKKPADAIKFFELSAKRFPNEASNYYYLGLSEWQIGAIVETPGTPESRAHFDKAKDLLNKFLGMAPNTPEAVNAKKILDLIK